MSYLEELLPEFRKGAKIRKNYWHKMFYVYLDGGIIRNQDGEDYCFDGDDLTGGLWEFYKAPEPDWQYIIDNKCLCCFWDDCDKDNRRIGLLTKISISGSCNHHLDYLMNGRAWYDHCRPVRKDEVTFYEDKKDD